jgi:hypothetical protein
MTTLPKEDNPIQEKEREAKIQELREIIANAQETISSATQLLSAIQGTTPTEMPISQTNEQEEDGQAIYGYFDGQIMIGDDGRQYPVPANYASKSKLVEGDKLKLNITPDNRFVYKQIGPVQRNYLIGLVKKDAKGNFTIQTPEKEYQVLLAAATYFKIEEGDEVTLIVPQGKTTIWGAIENVLQKSVTPPPAVETIQSPVSVPSETTVNTESIPEIILEEDSILAEEDTSKNINTPANTDKTTNTTNTNEPKELTAIEKLEMELEKERTAQENAPVTEPKEETASDDEWASDIEKLKQEAGIAAS